MRVVSLVPSVTETLLAWGVTPVGVTRFCEQPELKAVGGTKNPDLDAVVALAPDLVVMDTEENRRTDADALNDAGVTVHVTAVRSLADVAPTLAALAGAVGVDPPHRPLDPVALVPPAEPARRAFVPIWRRPWMTISGATYGSSVLTAVGVTNVYADAADPYPTVELAEVIERTPDVALVPTEPYDFTAEHRDELAAALGCPALEVDGKDLFWWGVRTLDAVARLGAALHTGGH